MKPLTLFISNIPWDFVWQRHQSLASLFARDGEVIFCEIPGIRRPGWRDATRILSRLGKLMGAVRPGDGSEPPPAGVRLARPFVLPATGAASWALNARLLDRWLQGERALATGVDLIVNYSPAHTARQLIERVPHRRLIYDCTDNWLAVRGIPACLPGDEQAILARADLTLVPSRELEALKRPHARRIERLPHGALVERFLLEPKLPAAGGALTLLYYGHLHAQHLDFAAIDAMARARPAWRIILVGPVKTPHAFPSNVELPGQQPHPALRGFVARADVLLLPYALNDYTRSVLPAKIYECLATGRPIVAAPLPELVQDFSAHLHFVTRPDEWVAAVERAVATQTDEGRRARIAIAQGNTWERRYAQLRDLLARLA